MDRDVRLETKGKKSFAGIFPPEVFYQTKAFAANQGLYSGFLAARLIWCLSSDPLWHPNIASFFLGCVIIAGIYGAATGLKKTFFIQSVPASVALILVLLSR
ncbi:DUF1304 domain-containing protein [Mucilaginibacter celer]|uniref:DUF1304 domain-containing protein n=1 Tax=Mucilaginibacter celer TaxID=2305508 RepID=UPI001FDEFBAE|nr:DUF1304 domain-containing protein [Mucilaginibacter celer]